MTVTQRCKATNDRYGMNEHGFKVQCALLTALCAAGLSHAQAPAATNATPPSAALASLERNGKRDARVHDPSTIVKCKDEYWFFATGVGVSSWRSKDLLRWERGPRVFDTPPLNRKAGRVPMHIHRDAP